jgi:hypothetical protein
MKAVSRLAQRMARETIRGRMSVVMRNKSTQVMIKATYHACFLACAQYRKGWVRQSISGTGPARGLICNAGESPVWIWRRVGLLSWLLSREIGSIQRTNWPLFLPNRPDLAPCGNFGGGPRGSELMTLHASRGTGIKRYALS